MYLRNDDSGELELLPRDEAIRVAHGRGGHLIAQWPAAANDRTPSCVVGRVDLPLRWETVPEPDPTQPDEQLWFEAVCGGRDLLLPGQGHTFRGRMTAWCPDREVSYNVSLGDMGEMSEAARYFVLGFLSGNEPGPPVDDEGDIDLADLEAWRSGTSRFRRTGSWYGRWGTCFVCGCVLLPDSSADRCATHQEDPDLARYDSSERS